MEIIIIIAAIIVVFIMPCMLWYAFRESWELTNNLLTEKNKELKRIADALEKKNELRQKEKEE